MVDSQQDGVGGWKQSGPLTGELIKHRMLQNYPAVVSSLAVSELNLLLVQESLLTPLEAEPISDAVCLLRTVEEKAQQIGPEAYTTLYQCISQRDKHLGHKYVKALLEGRDYTSEEEKKQSDTIKLNVQDNLSRFVDCNFPALISVMVSCELTSLDEGEQLLTAQVDKPTLVLRLVNLLNTKGPLAYGLFAECLYQETEHITHRELHALVIQPTSSRKRRLGPETYWEAVPIGKYPLPKHKLHGYLRGRQYNDLMRKFQSYHHNGKWAELEAVAASLLSNDTPPELQVVGQLESAVSQIFRKEAAKVVQLVGKAKECLTKVKGNNSKLLDGRCEYILSRLYRYLKDYDKAQEHIEKAAYLLQYAEPGEDSAFVHYCDACIKVERLSDNSTTQEIVDTEMCYKHAIDHAHRHDSGLDLVAPHSLMRLALMHLGSSHYMAGSKHDPESIRKAGNYLSQVDVVSLAQRSKCHFYFIQSDFQRSQGNVDKAKDNAQLALDVAEKYSFTLEICSARNRLDSLTDST